ncbi:MAG: membrane dipeptidase [Gammaproteobacteria bacterium]|nr:membrane dipeptidase [Gammaproteobacteria bacterium]
MKARERVHPHDGAPHFLHYPRHDTFFHQQMYIDWVYRAYTHGLRLIVVSVTNSETLCEFATQAEGASCDDTDVIERQLSALKHMDRWIHLHEGGWLQWAHSAQEARDIIEDNRLAVVAATEVDTLFGCEKPENGCDVKAGVELLFDRGVRHVGPIHLANNGLGGNALYNEFFAANNQFLRGSYPTPIECRQTDVTYTFRGGSSLPVAIKLLSFFKSGRWYSPDYAKVTRHCNELGLSRHGVAAIRELVLRGMIVDLEHMSDLSSRQSLELLESYDAPAMLSHTWLRKLKPTRLEIEQRYGKKFLKTHWDQQRSEMHSPDDLVRKVVESGGVVGLLLNQGWVSNANGSMVRNDCDTSSKSFAQALHHAHKLTGGSVGLGTDVNGLAGLPGPRFGLDACGGEHNQVDQQLNQRNLQRNGRRLRYDGTDLPRAGAKPINLARLGHEDMDLNVQGLAHYGLIPDFLADLRAIGTPENQIDALFAAALAYVEMWEKAEKAASKLSAR